MSPVVFEDMTPAEFVHVWFMYNDAQQEEIVQAWERTRWSTWILTTIQLDKKDRTPMKDMFPFPWEDELVTNIELSLEDRKMRIEELLKGVILTKNEVLHDV